MLVKKFVCACAISTENQVEFSSFMEFCLKDWCGGNLDESVGDAAIDKSKLSMLRLLSEF
jgi:hypothetical protein